MKGKRFLTLVLFSAAAAAVPPVRAWAQPAPNPTELALQETQKIRDTLFDKNKSPRERDEAAKRLLQRGANDILLEAMRSGSADLQIPVARALSYADNPPPEFLDSLLLCLQPQTGADLAEAVSLAIVNYRDNPDARARLRNFILSGNVGENARERAVHALGNLNDKDTAQFLVQTVLKGENPNITQRLSDAAADALVEMTGLTEYGRDYGQWNAWWASEQNKTPEQFLRDRLADRAAVANGIRNRLAAIQKSIDARAVDGLPRGANQDAERETYVLSYLKDETPEFRSAGASLAKLERSNNLTVGPAVAAKLRELIGDSSPEVRLRVADAIAAINDHESAKPLLAQLQREKIPGVKAGLIAALAPTNDISTVPELIKLLNDPSFQVSEAAAAALQELGPEIVKNQTLARQVSNELAQTIANTRERRGAHRLRQNVAYAMAPLKDPDLVQTLFSLLVDRESNPPPVRIAAIRALSSMNAAPAMQGDIANRLADTLRSDVDNGVRLEAATGLGAVGGPAQKQVLLNASSPAERDAGVRDAAWNSFSKILDQFSDGDLASLSEDFKGSPEKQLTVNLARIKKHAGENQSEELALIQENVGTLYLDPAIDKPDLAIDYLTKALAYWDSKGPGARTLGNQSNLLDAYLRAKRYKESTKFAETRIKKDEQNQDPIALRFLQEIDRLEKSNEIQTARDLLTDLLQLPFTKNRREQLVEREKALNSRVLPFFDHRLEEWIAIFA